jgi:hypothetical protein
VADHGEVYTAPREVNAMLDLVKRETERVDSRFLEPACGTGNFLDEILRRKLAALSVRYAAAPDEWRFNAFIAVSSLYGIDILADNVAVCRERLLGIVLEECSARRCEDAGFAAALRFVLSENIIHGDALTLLTCGDPPVPIIFSEWSPLAAFKVQRRDFRFDSLTCGDLPLFADTGENVLLPKPVRDDYKPAHFLEVGSND